jgi:hypothetical protein
VNELEDNVGSIAQDEAELNLEERQRLQIPCILKRPAVGGIEANRSGKREDALARRFIAASCKRR